MTGHVLREPPVCPLEDTGPRLRFEDPLSLIEIARHQPLAVARVVLVASAAEDRLSTRLATSEPDEFDNVEVAAGENTVLPEEGSAEIEGRNDLDSRPPELRLDQLDGSLSRGVPAVV